MTDETKPAWSGFWRRLGAFLIDGIILGVVGLVAGSTMFDYLASLAGPTRLVGLVVGVVYFGWLTSGAGGSATIGMRALGLRVIAMKGRPLNLLEALWRALILQLIFTLNGMMFQGDDVATKVLGVVAVTFVGGVGLAQILLLLFNTPSRRLVHDLLSGSAVVRAGTETVPQAKSWTQGAAVVVVALAFFAGVAATVVPLDKFFPAARALRPLTSVQGSVGALPEVLDVSVNDNTTTFFGSNGPETTRTLVVTARLREKPKDADKEVARIGDAVLKDYKLAPGQKLRVVLRRGYDIGIGHATMDDAHDYAPAPVSAKEPAATTAAPDASAPAAKSGDAPKASTAA